MGQFVENIAIRDKIERKSVDSLVPYARNARTHSEEQISQIAAIIREFGWTMPVLVDGALGIIAGHGRVLAAKKLGMPEVPTIDAGDLTEAQQRAYILADNQLGLNSGWDKKLLGLELGELSVLGFDMGLTGFHDADMNSYMSAMPVADSVATDAENEVPDTPQVVVTRLGDVWCLGEHRIMCADATDKQAVNVLMQGKLAALCFTSPPYSDQRDYANGGIDDWDALMRGVFGLVPMRADGQVLVNLGLVHRKNEVVAYWDAWLKWMGVCAWRRFGWYVWDQGPGMPGDWNGRLAPSFEFVFHFNRETRLPNKNTPCKSAGEKSHAKASGSMRSKNGKGGGWTHVGSATQDNKIPDSVIRITRQKGGIGEGIDHPAIFPVGLPLHMMLAYSNPGDICYEPFLGSGTSLVAAEKSRRALRGVELSGGYVDVALERFRRLYPSIPITLASTGEPYAVVAAQRAPLIVQETAPV